MKIVICDYLILIEQYLFESSKVKRLSVGARTYFASIYFVSEIG